MQEKDQVIDFLGIGVQKAGTSWLNERLKELPDITVPPIKEIHYFDRNKKYFSPNVHSRDNLLSKLTSLGWYRRLKKDLVIPVSKGDFKNLKWKFKFFFENPTDEWYLSLFKNFEGKCGEITPYYSGLEIDDIKKIKELLPNVKIILLLRDPIERAWSNYRYIHKEEDFKNIPKIINFIDSKSQESRSDYINIIKKYNSVFDEKDIYISFYGRISQEPKKLLSEIVEFIGGDPKNINEYCNIESNNNVSKHGEMPEEVLKYLRKKYKSDIQHLAKEFSSFPEIWMSKHYNN